MRLHDALFLVLALVLIAGALMLTGCAGKGNHIMSEVPSLQRIWSETPGAKRIMSETPSAARIKSETPSAARIRSETPQL